MIRTLTSEAAASTGAAGSAGACGVCLTELGFDPATASIVAVVVGVAVRLAVDWWERRRARRREVADAR